MQTGILFLFAVTGALPGLPEELRCSAQATAGFDDQPGTPEVFIPSVFYETRFQLKLNKVLMNHLTNVPGVDAYYTLESDNEPLELTCKRVRGTGGRAGISCTDNPPGQLLIIDLESLRFSRSGAGAWTFSTPELAHGGSLFIEYGRCAPVPD